MKNRLVPVLMAAGLVLAACGSSDDSGSAAATAAPATQAPSDAPAASQADAVFVPTADGGELDFNSLRGQDVLLWFWAPW